MKLYLDTEFNGFNGELISMALVAEDGTEFYEVLDYSNLKIDTWVKKHVLSVLNKESISRQTFSCKLKEYLNKFESVTIVADWPEDIAHFCQALIIGPGKQITTPPLFFVIDYNLPDTSLNSKTPHNALEDARCLIVN